MELKFIWIKDYNNIKNVGFNFNHSINEEFQFINNEIKISPKLTHTPDNFFKKNITGVTAIVGKNGSGKTNLTEFINYNVAHATNGGLSTYINCKGITILDNFIFVQNKIEIKNEEYLKSKKYRIIKFENAPLDDGQKELMWHKMEKNKYIYYNPTFDLRSIDVRDNLVNISTTNLVYMDINNSNKTYSAFQEKSISQLKVFEIMEKSRICDFVLNFKDANNFIEYLPEYLLFSLDTIDNNDFLKKSFKYGEDLDHKNIKINELQREIDTLESYYISFYSYNKYFIRNKENSTGKYYSIPIDEQKSIFYNLFFINIFQCLLGNEIIFPNNFFRKFIYEDLYDFEIEDKEKLKQILRLKDLLLELIQNLEWFEYEFILADSSYDSVKKSVYKNLGRVEISIAKNKTLLNKVIDLMDNLLDKKRIFSYETLNEFSSGQKHLITLYSRFFWARNQIINDENEPLGIKRESIIIFIDEGEVALHPEWQRVFFNKVASFLSELFSDKKIQLILTTHSPFVLSDIPKNNVLFLESDIKGNCALSNIEKENTFGANIYSLLADSFFMENTIGKFAEIKMKEGLKILKSKHTDYSDDKINELIYIIDSIGEPIIKEQFEYLYKIKFQNNDEVFNLKRRIVELEKQLKKESDDTDKN